MTSTQKPTGRSTGRIILGLGATSDVERSVDIAITLAKANEREILGLFVIEEEMVEMAGLPFTCTTEASTAQRLELTPHIMSEVLDRGASRCRQSLSIHAQRADVSWSFNVESGKLQTRLSAALAEGDYLILSSDRYGFDDPHLLDRLHFAPGLVEALVITPSRTNKNRNGPVIVLDDGDAAGQKTLRLAIRIAQTTNKELSLLALARSEQQMKLISDRAVNLLPAGQKMSIHRLVPGASDALKAAFTHLSPSFIVADIQGDPFENDKAAQTLLRTASAPVMLLRSSEKLQ